MRPARAVCLFLKVQVQQWPALERILQAFAELFVQCGKGIECFDTL